MRLFALTSILCWTLVQNAAAQADDPWLIVGTTSNVGDAWMKSTASELRSELLHRGVEVWSLQAAAARFADEGSAPASVLADAEIAAWSEQSRAGLWHLAMGESRAALDTLNQAQELSVRAIDALNRNQEQTQKVLDTCLYTLRALIETGFQAEANVLGSQCRQLVPRGEASPGMHPAFVLEILSKVDAERADKPASLHVRSEPSGCGVRVNGMKLGETPLRLNDLLPASYRVQVECDPDSPGRVHVADASAGSAEVFVDARFDRSVETEPLLQLRYASAEEERQYRVADSAQIARVVPAGALLVMSTPTPTTLEIELLGAEPSHQKALTRVTTGAYGPSRGDVALAARALVDGKCIDFRGTQPVPLPCQVAGQTLEDTGRAAGRRPRGQFIAGVTLAGVGSAALLGGYVLMAPRARAAEDWVAQLDSGDPPDGVAQQRWLDMSTAIVLTSSIGAGALVAAMPLALPDRPRPPWWAWVSGGLGVGLAAFSIAYGVTADAKPNASCSDLRISSPDAQACARHAEQASVAILTGLTAAPLLTIPLVYLLRRDRTHLEPGVQVSRAGAYLSLRGEF